VSCEGPTMGVPMCHGHASTIDFDAVKASMISSSEVDPFLEATYPDKDVPPGQAPWDSSSGRSPPAGKSLMGRRSDRPSFRGCTPPQNHTSSRGAVRQTGCVLEKQHDSLPAELQAKLEEGFERLEARSREAMDRLQAQLDRRIVDSLERSAMGAHPEAVRSSHAMFVARSVEYIRPASRREASAPLRLWPTHERESSFGATASRVAAKDGLRRAALTNADAPRGTVPSAATDATPMSPGVALAYVAERPKPQRGSPAPTIESTKLGREPLALASSQGRAVDCLGSHNVAAPQTSPSSAASTTPNSPLGRDSDVSGALPGDGVGASGYYVGASGSLGKFAIERLNDASAMSPAVQELAATASKANGAMLPAEPTGGEVFQVDADGEDGLLELREALAGGERTPT